jgi:hypothetical protein
MQGTFPILRQTIYAFKQASILGKPSLQGHFCYRMASSGSQIPVDKPADPYKAKVCPRKYGAN